MSIYLVKYFVFIGADLMKMVLRVRRNGVLILPKKLVEAIGLNSGDYVIAEVRGDKLVLRGLKPKVVDVDPAYVEKLLREEHELERNKYR